jgi:hypothetical protein
VGLRGADWLGLDDASAFDPGGFDADGIAEELALSDAGCFDAE